MSAALALEGQPACDIRRLPVPCCDPPYDPPAEPSTFVAAWQGPVAVQTALDLAFALPSGVPAVPEPPTLRLVKGGAKARKSGGESETPLDPNLNPLPWRPREPIELPDSGSWAPRLVQALIEVLNGLRPAPQLVRWTNADVYSAVQQQVRSTAAARSRPGGLLVRSVRSFEPDDGIAEVTAVIQIGPRVRALALRLEALANRWQCTALDLI